MNILSHPLLFLPPARVMPPFGWVGHIPFGMLLTGLLKPGVFVELGTHSGNSFNAFCQAVDYLELGTQCFAVDSWEGDPHAGNYDNKTFQSLKTYVDGHYSSFANLLRMTFDDAKTHFLDSSIDLLHIDGYHTYEAVRHDFENWLPKLSDRSVVLLHDTHVRQADFGVWRFWEEIKEQYPSLEFSHSHGLGVLFVGKQVPTQMATLLDMDAGTWMRFQHLIERIGTGTGIHEQLAAKDDQIQELLQQTEQFRKDIHQLHLDWQASLLTRDEEMQKCEAHARQQILLAQQQAMAAEQQVIAAEHQAKMAREQERNALEHSRNLGVRIDAIENSTSWRITKPMRSLSTILSTRFRIPKQ